MCPHLMIKFWKNWKKLVVTVTISYKNGIFILENRPKMGQLRPFWNHLKETNLAALWGDLVYMVMELTTLFAILINCHWNCCINKLNYVAKSLKTKINGKQLIWQSCFINLATMLRISGDPVYHAISEIFIFDTLP